MERPVTQVGVLRECHVCFALTAPAKERAHVEQSHANHLYGVGSMCKGCKPMEGTPEL